MPSNACVVFITTPTGRKAKRLAQTIVKNRAAACVNIVPRITSIYWWKGKIQSDGESLLIVKTQKRKYKQLEKIVRKNHPYDVPEIIALPVIKGFKPYLNWIQRETKK